MDAIDLFSTPAQPQVGGAILCVGTTVVVMGESIKKQRLVGKLE
jgi:S-adenosylmethionine:tRNA-ribosyltransferase-isomerase (queuine synthetase)